MSFGHKRLLTSRQQAPSDTTPADACDSVPLTLLKAARQSGVLNLADRGLTALPAMVWQLNCATDDSSAPSLDSGDQRWWEFEETKKLLLCSNRLTELSEDIRLLPCLCVVDVRDNQLLALPDSIGQLQQLRTLNANRNRMQLLPESLGACCHLAALSVAENQLQALPSSIGDLKTLVDLDVSGNRLKELPDCLSDLQQLRLLDCSRNQLQRLPDSVAALPQLQQLLAAGNQIVMLPCPASGSAYRNVEVLDVCDNQLERLPTLRHSPKLKELRASNNRISLLTPDQVSGLSGLKLLELRRNKLAELPPDIADLPQLERIDLGDNDLSGLPHAMGLMESLKNVVLDGNPLRTVRREVVARGTTALKQHLASRIADDRQPDAQEIGIVTSLQGNSGVVGAQSDIDINEVRQKRSLKLTGRELSSIPASVFACIGGLQVSKIDFGNNDLEELPEQLAESAELRDSLQELSLRNNRLAALDPRVGQLVALTHLDLSMNSLADLPPELQELQCLRELALMGNRFATVPDAVYSLRSLEHLMISSNKIQHLQPERLRHLRQLATLDVSNNSIATVPPELGLCSQLKSLQLEGNLFRVPRPAQLAKGTAYVLEYLRSRLQQ